MPDNKETPHPEETQNTIVCCSCGEEIEDGDQYTHEEDTYCQECYDEAFYSCDRCGCSVERDEVTQVRPTEEYYCTGCLERKCHRCCDCGEYWLDERTQILHNGQTICEGCYENGDYSACSNCGDLFYIDDLHYDENDNCYCTGCYDGRPEQDSILHGHDYTPRLSFKKTSKEVKPVRYYGIELEIECEYKAVPDDIEGDYFYLKYDGSLHNGFEVVSHPATWNWIQEHKQKWNDILDLRKEGYRSYEPGTCGMHVHISREAFTTWMLYKWLHFFSNNPDFVVFFSSRGSMGTNWCKIDDKGEIMYKAKSKHCCNRYEAINLNNRKTVEIRIFRGTLNPVKFWANLEFIEALFGWLDPFRPKDIASMTVDSFLTYAHLHEKQYPNLFSWLSAKVPSSGKWVLTPKQETSNVEDETCVS